jgi:hypothetical protein
MTVDGNLQLFTQSPDGIIIRVVKRLHMIARVWGDSWQQDAAA